VLGERVVEVHVQLVVGEQAEGLPGHEQQSVQRQRSVQGEDAVQRVQYVVAGGEHRLCGADDLDRLQAGDVVRAQFVLSDVPGAPDGVAERREPVAQLTAHPRPQVLKRGHSATPIRY
jgi:hypothetical protein